jgi:GNAT superfamily N-acetyltransferase
MAFRNNRANLMILNSPITPHFHITPFTNTHQSEARSLILQGLGEHWGWIDEQINTDLVDIAVSYSSGHFILGFLDNILVATGALIPESETSLRIVRMSVDREYRRQGIATGILDHLIRLARSSGVRSLVLETNEPWVGVIRFYLEYGFQITAQGEGKCPHGHGSMIGGITALKNKSKESQK